MTARKKSARKATATRKLKSNAVEPFKAPAPTPIDINTSAAADLKSQVDSAEGELMRRARFCADIALANDPDTRDWVIRRFGHIGALRGHLIICQAIYHVGAEIVRALRERR